MSDELLDWLHEQPSARTAWRALAERLLGSVQDMPTFVAVGLACEQTESEMKRGTRTEEDAAFDLVKTKIHELRQAVERSPLQKGAGFVCEITGRDVPDAWLEFGWYERSEPSLPGYSASLMGTLDLAERLLAQHRAYLPTRAARRHRDRPRVAAFVHLLGHFGAQVGLAFSEERIAELANAALQLDRKERQSKATVRAIMKTPHPLLKTAERKP